MCLTNLVVLNHLKEIESARYEATACSTSPESKLEIMIFFNSEGFTWHFFVMNCFLFYFKSPYQSQHTFASYSTHLMHHFGASCRLHIIAYKIINLVNVSFVLFLSVLQNIPFQSHVFWRYVLFWYVILYFDFKILIFFHMYFSV